MIDEKTLMLKVKHGELNHLADLFENNKSGLFHFFLKMGMNHALSEDFIQETFMRVLAYRNSFQAKSSFKAWLYRIARNAVVDHFRKMANQNIHDDFVEETMHNQQTLTDSIEQQTQLEMFNKALASLPLEQREIIVLSRFQQLNYTEIAELLNCNLNTLKTRMRTAIGQLKIQYQQLSGEIVI